MAPPRRRPRSNTGFRGVRARESGRFSAVITYDRRRWYMGTFDSAEEAAREYDFAVFTFGADRRLLNFRTTRDLAEAERLALDGIRIVSMQEERESRRAERQIRAEQRTEALLARMMAEEPGLAAANAAYFAAKDGGAAPPKVKKEEAGPSTALPEVKKEDAGPSTIVIESSSDDFDFDMTDDEFAWED